jgi:hypothetical protein
LKADRSQLNLGVSWAKTPLEAHILEGALGSFLGFLAGLWGSTYLQDRDIRRRHLGIVRALRAELVRIGQEVGINNPEYITISISGSHPMVPQLAPWVQTLLTDLASSNASLLSHFMDLDRHLHNLRSADVGETKALANVDDKQKTVDLTKNSESVLVAMKAEHDLKEAQKGVELADFVTSTSFKYVKTTHAKVAELLDKEDRRLSAGFWTHLPWRRAS